MKVNNDNDDAEGYWHSKEELMVTIETKGWEFDTDDAWDTEKATEYLRELFTKNISVVPKDSTDVGCLPSEYGELEIPLKRGAVYDPTRCYRSSDSKRAAMRIAAKDLYDKHIIRPATTETKGCPMLTVAKPDLTWRACIDFKARNATTEKDDYIMKTMRDVRCVVVDAGIMFCLDLTQAFWHVKVKERDRWKSTFTDADLNRWEWCRMPMGLTNSPMVLQRILDTIFGDLKYVIVYIDDILIATPDLKTHLETLSEVFKRLADLNLRVKPGKCKFFWRRLKWLGLYISAKGIEADPEYCEGFMCLKEPSNRKELQRLLGVYAWIQGFIPGAAMHTRPLNELKKKDVRWNWTPECQTSFDRLKKAVETRK